MPASKRTDGAGTVPNADQAGKQNPSYPADPATPAVMPARTGNEFPVPAERVAAEERDSDESETKEQREERESRELDHAAAVESGFIRRADVPAAEVKPVPDEAYNMATLDGIPVPMNREFETVIDPHSGAIVQIPADVRREMDERNAKQKQDEERENVRASEKHEESRNDR